LLVEGGDEPKCKVTCSAGPQAKSRDCCVRAATAADQWISSHRLERTR